MQTLTQIRALLEQAGHPPKKALGQNFLIDHNLIRKLVDDSGVQPGDLVMEVGPGTGALTVELLERGCQVIACELDQDLVRVLRETLGVEFPEQLTIIEGDCLANKRAIDPGVIEQIGGRSFKLVANLPYHAATPLMIALMTQHPNCVGMYTTIQHEVVERFNASAGTKAYGTISIIAQCLGKVGTIAKLAPGCFWPQPSVGSAMMRWVRSDEPLCTNDPAMWVEMAQMTQTMFQMRRKKITTAIKQITKNAVVLPEGMSEDDRIDAISPAQVAALCANIHAAMLTG